MFHVLKKNKLSKNDLFYIIYQNYIKAQKISNSFDEEINYEQILNSQIEMKNNINYIYVLSTFPLLVVDYNPNILNEIRKCITND